MMSASYAAALTMGNRNAILNRYRCGIEGSIFAVERRVAEYLGEDTNLSLEERLLSMSRHIDELRATAVSQPKPLSTSVGHDNDE